MILKGFLTAALTLAVVYHAVVGNYVAVAILFILGVPAVWRMK